MSEKVFTVHHKTRESFFSALKVQATREYARNNNGILEEYDPDEDTPLASVVRNILAKDLRTYPALEVFYEGTEPLDPNSLADRYSKTDVKDLENFQSNLIFVESEDGKGVAWKKWSASYTRLSGKVETKSEYMSVRKKISSTLITASLRDLGSNEPFEVTANELFNFFKKKWREAIAAGGVNLSIASGAGNPVYIVLLDENGVEKYLLKSKIAALGFSPILAKAKNANLNVKFGDIKAALKSKLLPISKLPDGTTETDRYAEIDSSTGAYPITIIPNDTLQTVEVDEDAQSSLEQGIEKISNLPPTAIGHTESVSADKQKYFIQVLKDTLSKDIEGVLRDSAPESEDYQIALIAKKYIEKWLLAAEETLRITRLVGRNFSDKAFEFKKGVKVKDIYEEIKNNKNLLTKNVDGTEYLGFYSIINTETGFSITKNEGISKTIMKFPLGSRVFVPLLASNNSGVNSQLEAHALKILIAIINVERSPPLITRVLTTAISKIFDDPKLANYVKKYTGIKKTKKKLFVPLVKIKKLKRPAKLKRLKAPNVPKRNAKNAGRRQKTVRPTSAGYSSSQQTYSNFSVLDVINANIYQAVKEQMTGEGTLQYRSGRFAKSVRAIDVSDNTLSFTYMKRPYEVFSGDSGASPWNSVPKRDPAAIVDAAIKSLAGKKLISGIVAVTAR